MQSPHQAWRHANIGRVLNNAVRRFEERVLEILAEGGNAPTRLSHLGLTRNLDVEGTRATELARRAAMTKQAMAELVGQCEELGLVSRQADPTDRRAKIITFTAKGLRWLEAFHQAIMRAEEEMRAELGWLRVDGLVEALRLYGSSANPLRP
ncbi:DNA-binding MarR family transcriptional regulator [Sphingomonas vulcanisoli]|uniref:DNA-binding MarR family transcriptional regulator n=1 Tax=Sphingomonas vulcanisoli TaxID=1658060 RepID=A0ABX0TVR7_9SPHN|nr:MarR family transcriptional regulator [Sphingomonas vulcanisoli]NIJ09631.1 DNA-binding MarR family transcriptional regulator [Sphingomonas vulcanisoli]